MSWTGKLSRTEREGDHLNVVVHYSDDLGREFDQTLSATSVQDDTWLKSQINTKIKQLTDLDGFETSLNDSTPKETSFSVDENGSTIIDLPKK